jgi:hypothetical protein
MLHTATLLLRPYSGTEMGEILEWSDGGMIMTGKTNVLSEKPGPVPLECSPQFARVLAGIEPDPAVMTALRYSMWGGNGSEPSKDVCSFFKCDSY